VKAARQTDFM